MSKTPLYSIDDLRHRFKNNFLLDIPRLSIEEGVSLGFVGPNGSGKSTLLKILAFLEKPLEGTVYFRGKDGFAGSGYGKREVTLLFQAPYLLKRSVFDNISYGLRARGTRNELTARVDQALRTVGLPPEGFARRKWYELSGGEARRVALASRIVFRPRVLILDEPTANIDRYSSSLIKEAITLIRSRYGTTLIVASHDLVWLQGVVDTTLELHDGHLVEYNRDNLLRGPWVNAGDGLWKKLLPDGQVIFAANPPHHGDAVAVLNPSHVIVSTAGPVGLSARNLLKGKITLMTVEKEPGKVRIEIDVSGLPLVSSVTQQAVKALGLVPGKTAWAVFKVSSLKWY